MDNKFLQLKEEEKEFLFKEFDTVFLDDFQTKIETILNNISDKYNNKFNSTLTLSQEDLEDLFKVLELRWCENCGKVENVYNGGGTANDMTCCSDCLELYNSEEEEEEEEEFFW